MRDGGNLLDDLEAFVDANVHVGAWTAPAGTLRAKLDILERVVELLRLRTGITANDLPMKDALARGLVVECSATGNRLIRLDEVPHSLEPVGAVRPGGFKQTELQVPLLLFVFGGEPGGLSIGKLIAAFVRRLQKHLSVEDVETTGTGVTRIVTTTRSTARALRTHGLFVTSRATHYRTWQLSVLGVLVGAMLSERLDIDSIPERRHDVVDGGAHGSSIRLADPIRSIVGSFRHPEAVWGSLLRICGENSDVLPSFDKVVRLISAFCDQLYDSDDDHIPLHARRQAVVDLIASLEMVIPHDVLQRDFATDSALKFLVRQA